MARTVLGRDPFTRPIGQAGPTSSPPAAAEPHHPQKAEPEPSAEKAAPTQSPTVKKKRRRPTRPKRSAFRRQPPPAVEKQTATVPSGNENQSPAAAVADREVDRAELVAEEKQAWATGTDSWWRYTRLFRPSFYGSQLRRWHLSLHSEQVDAFGYDPRFWQRLEPLLQFLFERFWRVELAGLEQVPAGGRLMLVANHAGCLPWDGLLIKFALEQRGRSGRGCRFLVEDFIHYLPFLGTWFNRLGAVRACQDNALRLLEQELALVVFPEGIKGLGKLYKDRYRLQRFGRGGFVKLALRTGTPILPVAVLGSEETYPLLARLEWPARQLGLPFLPVTPTFPWLGPLGLVPLPARWKIIFGSPVAVPLNPAGAEQPQQVMELVERVRESIQHMLDDELLLREGGVASASPPP